MRVVQQVKVFARRVTHLAKTGHIGFDIPWLLNHSVRRNARSRLAGVEAQLLRSMNIFRRSAMNVETYLVLRRAAKELINRRVEHPARDMQDTFYTTEEGILLRTHTSPGQIAAMREYHPQPIRIIVPGMCYRSEQITARSGIQFNQIEGLAVGHGIRFSDLKGTLTEFAKRLFGAQRKTRFRASYFPFTEPSAEMDVSCFQCDAAGCQLCKYSGWLEILGCGMVHPIVLGHGGYDPDEFSGFAWGLGPERIAMMKYGITDIRSFWGDDLRFLSQF